MSLELNVIDDEGPCWERTVEELQGFKPGMIMMGGGVDAGAVEMVMRIVSELVQGVEVIGGCEMG